nr:condensation domain-containing protein [uncultured Chitinophaga sp.]
MGVTAKYQIVNPGFVQVREWMLYKIREDHYPMNLTLVFYLDMFDVGLFRKAIDLIVKRHEIFRTTLRVTAGGLKQVIVDPEDFRPNFEYMDFSGVPSRESTLLIANKKLLLSNTPFNFEYGPLFRVAVFKKEAGCFEVSWVFHHVIIDSYSAGVFEAEIVRIWDALVQGNEHLVPDDIIKYQQYTAIEEDLLNTQAGDPYRAYWKSQLSQGLPRLQIIDQQAWNAYNRQHEEKVKEVKRRVAGLPFSDDRFIASVVRRYTYNQAGLVEFAYAADTFRQIQDFTGHYSSSLYTLFIAGFLMAMHKLSGQSLFAFDIPVTRRTDGICKKMIGWLASGGICYFDMAVSRKAESFLEYIDVQLFQLAKHCVYPFETVDCEAEIPIGSTVPVFLTLTKNDYDKEGDLSSSGILKHYSTGAACCQDMDIYLTTYGDVCHLKLVYNNSLLTPTTVEKLITEQERCLNSLLEELLHG